MSLVKNEEVTMLLQSNLIENEDGLLALADAIRAWDYLRGERHITHEVVRHTHELLMVSRDTLSPKWKGFYRTIPVFVGGHAGMPSERIELALDALYERLNDRRFGPRSDEGIELWTKKLHVAFERIHPFVDGNGRIGRMLYNWQRLHFQLPVHVIHVADRAKYYSWFKDDDATTASRQS